MHNFWIYTVLVLKNKVLLKTGFSVSSFTVVSPIIILDYKEKAAFNLKFIYAKYNL